MCAIRYIFITNNTVMERLSLSWRCPMQKSDHNRQCFHEQRYLETGVVCWHIDTENLDSIDGGW